MTIPPFDTGAARTLAIVASQTPTAGHTADRAALITTILDACAEVERLRARVAMLEEQAHDRRQEDIKQSTREP